MADLLMTGLLPSATLFTAAGGMVVVTIGAVLLQKAARIHLREQRCEQLRKQVARVEAQWHEAAS